MKCWDFLPFDLHLPLYPFCCIFSICRLIVSSKELETREARSFSQGFLLKITDVAAKAKVLESNIGDFRSLLGRHVCNGLTICHLILFAGCFSTLSGFWRRFTQCISSTCDAYDVIKDDRLSRNWVRPLQVFLDEEA